MDSGIIVVVCCVAGVPTEAQPGVFVCLDAADGHQIDTCTYGEAGRVTSVTLHSDREPQGDRDFIRSETCARYDAAGNVVQAALVWNEDSQDLGREMWGRRLIRASSRPERPCPGTVVA